MFIHRFDCYWLIIDVSGGFFSSHFLKDNVDFIFVFHFFLFNFEKKNCLFAPSCRASAALNGKLNGGPYHYVFPFVISLRNINITSFFVLLFIFLKSLFYNFFFF